LPPDGTTAFISYSREDSEFVLRMARDLKAAGADVWLDQLDIQPGQRWARALQDAITNSPRFLVILSPASVKSTNVEDEVTFALEERKTIIPVLYCDCNVPFQLRPFQYADFRHDYDHGLRILLHTMGVELASPFMPSAPAAAVAETQIPAQLRPAAEEGTLAAEEVEEAVPPAFASVQSQEISKGQLIAKRAVWAFLALSAIAIPIIYFIPSSKKELVRPIHGREIANSPPPATTGPVSSIAPSSTGTSEPVSSGDTYREALLGEHRLEMQWLASVKPGSAVVTENNGVLMLKGEQRGATEYLTMTGTVTFMGPEAFVFHGTMVTKVNEVNNGQPCTRKGNLKFAIIDNRRFWRLQQTENPCAPVKDLVDIYLR